MKEVFNGVVKKELLNAGSKSEGEYVGLVTDNGQFFPLRIKGENPFSSSKLEDFLGKTVSVEGTIYSSELFVDSASDIKVQPRPPKSRL